MTFVRFNKWTIFIVTLFLVCLHKQQDHKSNTFPVKWLRCSGSYLKWTRGNGTLGALQAWLHLLSWLWSLRAHTFQGCTSSLGFSFAMVLSNHWCTVTWRQTDNGTYDKDKTIRGEHMKQWMQPKCVAAPAVRLGSRQECQTLGGDWRCTDVI